VNGPRIMPKFWHDQATPPVSVPMSKPNIMDSLTDRTDQPDLYVAPAYARRAVAAEREQRLAILGGLLVIVLILAAFALGIRRGGEVLDPPVVSVGGQP